MSAEPTGENDQTESIKFLFLSNQERKEDGSRLYRCVYQGKILEKFGHEVKVHFYGDATEELIADADIIIFSRCHFNQISLGLIRMARNMGKVICGDLDDRVYAPWAADETGFMRSKNMFGRRAEELRNLRNTHRDILRLLPLLDEIVVSTSTLGDELNALGFDAYVSRNAIDDSQWEPQQHIRTKLERLLFMTGTRTHDADLFPIVDVLVDFLLVHPDVELTILGPITPPESLTSLPNVRTVGKLPLSELYSAISEFDLCLVPLEDSLFNDCKSALKFYECGLVSVPVLASPRAEFARAIEHGKNGFLAESESEWRLLLENLYKEPGKLTPVGAAAHDSVLKDYTVGGRDAELANHYRTLMETNAR